MPDPILDAKAELEWALRALRALRDLVQEAGRSDDHFDLVRPMELAELLDMVTRRIEGPALLLAGAEPIGR